MFRWSHHDAWTFTEFFVVSIYISIFYVLASILYPAHAEDVPPFSQVRLSFYAAFIVYLLFEMLHTYIRDGSFSSGYVPMIAAVIILSGVGMVLRRNRYDVFFGILNVAVNTAWPFLARLKG